MESDKNNIENSAAKGSSLKPSSGFTKENLKKKFRFSEFFAEKLITFVAFLSIAVIILIFLFVFRESLPIFKGKEKTEITNTQNSTNEKSSDNNLKPESYGGENTELKPETYNSEEPSETKKTIEVLKPETYGDIEKPEQYGVITDTTPGNKMIADNQQTSIESNNESNIPQAWKTFGNKNWVPVSDNPRYGLWPLVVGTLKVTLIAILLAAPIAILAALYTSAFASRRKREIIKPIIELLAGFPSVVIGFFAMMVMASFFQNIFGYSSRLNAFIGGAAMALAAIPIIYTIAEDALSAVPKTFKEASLALGANYWQTAFFVTLPAATPGIFAAVLLGVGRVFGETMIALMATGNAALISANPFESIRTFAATIGAEMAETVFGDTHYSVLFFIGSILFVFTFLLNAIAEFYIKGKLIKKIQGR